MNYTERESKTAASRTKLAEVVKAGEAAGYWKNCSTVEPEGGDAWRWVEVETPAGLRFNLNGGSWGREGAISASVASLKSPEGVKVHASDVLCYQQTAPTASASYTRPAATIAKSLFSRVMASPEGVSCAEAMRARLAMLTASRSGLRAHMATLQALGYTFDRVSESETYKADGHKNAPGEPRNIRLYESGRVDFSASVQAENLAAVLDLLKGAK